MAERIKIDARGAYCPGPLMELIAALKLAQMGDELEVWSSDRGSATDIPQWVAKVGHELVGIEPRESYLSIVVRKAK
ncbi:MAG: sulfurtransferase TusA family protein [Alphaproteobacteria bacterium]|nr:sulfurtransferase TusA family protein [Alphaproteobacteria bacterium]